MFVPSPTYTLIYLWYILPVDVEPEATWSFAAGNNKPIPIVPKNIDDTALQKILQIQPKTYEYIDKVERGNDIVYGFIAQQIKEVIPEAVKIEKCIIPNILKVCNYNNDNTIKINESLNITTDETETVKECFVYGSKVDDFHTLDKTYIFI